MLSRENENACKASWAVHMSKIRVKVWLLLNSTMISESGSDLKITWSKANMEINSLTLHLLLIIFYSLLAPLG